MAPENATALLPRAVSISGYARSGGSGLSSVNVHADFAGQVSIHARTRDRGATGGLNLSETQLDPLYGALDGIGGDTEALQPHL